MFLVKSSSFAPMPKTQDEKNMNFQKKYYFEIAYIHVYVCA